MQEIEWNGELNAIAKAIHGCAVEKGWWEDDRRFPELIALMHSELSEALEAWRERKPPVYFVEDRPEGWAVELIDCVIRILDTLTRENQDTEDILRRKMQYNEGRPYRHGGKLG